MTKKTSGGHPSDDIVVHASDLPPCYPICRTCTLSPPFSEDLLLYFALRIRGQCGRLLKSHGGIGISRKTSVDRVFSNVLGQNVVCRCSVGRELTRELGRLGFS